MPQKKTVLQSITFTPESGEIKCKFLPQTVYDDGEVQVHPPHIMTLRPGDDPAIYINDNNLHFTEGVTDRHQVTRHYDAIGDADAAAIKAVAAAIHTPKMVKEYKKRIDDFVKAEATIMAHPEGYDPNPKSNDA